MANGLRIVAYHPGSKDLPSGPVTMSVDIFTSAGEEDRHPYQGRKLTSILSVVESGRYHTCVNGNCVEHEAEKHHAAAGKRPQSKDTDRSFDRNGESTQAPSTSGDAITSCIAEESETVVGVPGRENPTD